MSISTEQRPNRPSPLRAALRPLCALGVCGLIFAVALLRLEPGPSGRKSSAPSGSRIARMTPLRRTEHYLKKLSTSLIPQRRQQVIEQMRGQLDVLEGPLLSILANRNHPFLLPAAQAAWQLELPEARKPMLSLAKTGPRRVRFTAIGYLAQCPPLAQEVKKLLRHAEPAFILRGLESIDPNDVTMHELLIALLFHPDSAVRDAAAKRFPNGLGPERLAKLIEGVKSDPHVDRSTILRALTHVRGCPEIESLFYGFLQSEDAKVRLTALVGLGTRRELHQLGDVWHRLESNASTRAERVQAMRILEKTGAVSAERIMDVVPSLDPLERYFAARCLISKKNKAGVSLLLEILELPHAARVDPATRWDLVHKLTRKLIIRLSGTANDDAWAGWAQGPFDPKLPLPDPDFDIWQL